MKPRISIIIPVYNGAEFIGETIESCINQTYENWELILIDDGSTDNSKQIISEYLSNKISYSFKENGGQASARNLGIEKSTGDYIAFLDADDLWAVNKLEAQVKCLQDSNEIDLIYTAGFIFEKQLEEKKEYPIWIYGKQQGLGFVKKLYAQSGIINSSVILKRELLLEHKLDENPKIKGTEDWDLWLRLAMNGRTFFGLNDKLVYYREHEGGIHLNLAKMFLGKEQLYLKHGDNESIPKLLQKRQFRFVYRELMNSLFSQGKLDEIKPTFKRFKIQDQYGWGTLHQRILIKMLPLKTFIWVSNKIIYRVAYRIERLKYFLFLK